MPGDILCWFSEGVPDPTPLAPSYLGVDSLLFSSFPQFFVPYDLWPVDAHDGPQASVDKEKPFFGGFLCMFHVLNHTGRQTSRWSSYFLNLDFLDITFGLHTGLSIAKAVLAFPILVSMSRSDLNNPYWCCYKGMEVLHFINVPGVNPHHLCLGFADPRPVFSAIFACKPRYLGLYSLVVVGKEGNVVVEVQIFKTGCEVPLCAITISRLSSAALSSRWIAGTNKATTGIPGALLLASQTAQTVIHCGKLNRCISHTSSV